MSEQMQAAPSLEEAGAAIESKNQFPCGQCGAKLDFKPGSAVLQCPYCSHENPIPQSEEDIVEVDFAAVLAQLREQQPVEEHATVHCDGCGANVDKPDNVSSMTCPFCDSNIVMTPQSAKLIKPMSLLPFAVTREQAKQKFSDWINSLWFAPNKLKQYARVDSKFNGMYVPHWTFDSNTVSVYRGQRGEHYTTTETYTTTENGKTVTKTRQVTKTRWYPASGTVFCGFDDVLTPASNSLPRKYVEELEPWDLPQLVPYADEYLSGFSSETYTIELEDGFVAARQKMDSHIRYRVKRDIGGDEQRISSIHTQYNDVTFKHILLPMWISAYRFSETVYRFLVNARTGEVQGERPWSWVKITLAVLGAAAVLIGLLVMVNG